MSTPTIAEQLELAKRYCPDLILMRLRPGRGRKPVEDDDELADVRAEIAREVIREVLGEMEEGW